MSKSKSYKPDKADVPEKPTAASWIPQPVRDSQRPASSLEKEADKSKFTTAKLLERFRPQSPEEKAAFQAKLDQSAYDSWHKDLDAHEATLNTLEDWKEYAQWQRYRARNFEHRLQLLEDDIECKKWEAKQAKKGGRPGPWADGAAGMSLVYEFCKRHRTLNQGGEPSTDTVVLQSLLDDSPDQIESLLSEMTLTALKSRFIKERDRYLDMFG